ncbi:cellulose biosynthesis protein BcsR [Legionella sp. PATHC035]|uniref:cellulose biosynthesis protein BcsR n=1 Tax=Legionella sp. PATHC035 TaxID=2992040 RepID=UPI002244F271|nr:cellulose biosynthesis protein BcsR [Legionella sp. PATHC035]MCW8410068.1 cellulose biosynthesis protein BcsR [Legionella sp. PATHC035]
MKNQISDLHGLRSLRLQDDLLVLSRIYSLPRLGYVDISKQQIITEIIERWYILKEFSDTSSKR